MGVKDTLKNAGNKTILVVIGINRRLNSQMKGWIFVVSDKEIRDVEKFSAVPLSNESVKKKRNNLLKSVIGASVIATGLVMMPQATFAQGAEQPPAVVQREAVAAPSAGESEAPSASATEASSASAPEASSASASETPSASATETTSASESEAPSANAPETPSASASETTSASTTEAPSASASETTSASTSEAPSASATEATATNGADDAAKPMAEPAQAQDSNADELINDKNFEELFDSEKIKAQAEENIDVEEERTPEAQKAPAETTEPNYADDEKNIKDYSDEERYRSTQMEQGNGTAADYIPPDEMDNFIDGYRYHSSEPSATSEDKTQWGIEIEIDKEKGQRTYTDFYFTNTGNMGSVLDTGNVSANEAGEKIAGGEKDPNYKATSEIEIDGSRAQRNLNLVATEEDLKHINDKDNTNTTMAWQGKYKKDNPNGLKATEGGSAQFSFTVNPWPNENDKLELIKLNGKHDKKEFVQGQTIETGVSVENLDDSARERLVGQVYHPLTGEVVPGAKAYINDQGKVVVEMPKGTINEDGTLNEDSIFYKDAKYKGIQNLEVKFFARPRTADEFRAIVEGNGAGFYTGTGAGEETINHDGKDVVIDKQGIDRYDHYNLIGGFKINLDDTRYYDQDFKDKNEDDTSKHTHSKVKPGEEFNVDLYVPENKKDEDAFPNQKTPGEMEAAKDAKQAVGSIDTSFIDQINKGKEDKDKWVLDYDESTLPTTLKITPPKSAKAGDFVAVPLTYTYTNGSTDVHWFHFVVQESDYIKPDYETQVNFPAKEQTSPATVKDDGKRITPDHYTLPDTLETDEAGNKLVTDDSGNKWTVTLDEATGKVSAKPVNPLDFNGGEKLTVPVISHYVDDQKPGEDIKEETEAYFVIEEKANMTARYNAQAGKAGDKLSSDVILNEEDKYNRRPGKYTLESDTFVDDKGNTWKVTIDENTGKVTATVPEGVSNDKLDGALLNVPVIAHYYEEDGTLEVGTKKTEVQFVATGAELNNPQYNVSIGDGNSEMTNSVIINADDKKDSPSSYTIDETKTYTDDQGNEWTVTIDSTTGEVKATPTDPSKLKGGEKLQVPVTAHYGEGEEAPTQKATAEFVVKDKEYASPDYKAKVVKVGETQSADVKLTDGDNLKKPTKYTLDSDTFVDDKGNTWTVTIDETTGKVTAKAPEAAEGKVLELDGALLNVPVTAHYEDATGKEVTRKTSVQFIGTGTQGSYRYKETKPFETTVEYINDPTLAPGEWRYKEVGGKKLTGENGSVTYKVTIKDSVVQENEPEIVDKKDPVNAVIQINKRDYTGTVTHTEKIETPFEVEYQYSDELEAGQAQIKQKGEKGSYDLVYSQNIKNGEVDGEATTSKENEKEAKKEIIVIGIKPVKKVVETPFDTEYIYDDQLEAGKVVETEGEKGKTTITTSYDKDKNELVTKEEKTAPKDKVVRIGIKPVEKEVETDYKTRIEYDPNLEAGKVEKTDGEKGKTKITTTFNQETNKLETTEEVVKEPKDEVIKIGTKPAESAENTTEVSKEVGTKIEYIYDDTLELGEVILGDFTPGKVETKVVQKYDPKTGKIEAKEETTVTPGVQKIVVGTKKTDNTCPMPDPTDPTDPTNPKDPSNPDGDKPSNPDGDKPSNPDGDKPSNPDGDKPSNPGGDKPSHPTNPNPSEPSHPANPNPSTSSNLANSNPNRSDTWENSNSSRNHAVGGKKASPAVGGTTKDDAKAPQTFDPGIAAPTGLAALASGLLVGLERLKRRKRD